VDAGSSTHISGAPGYTGAADIPGGNLAPVMNSMDGTFFPHSAPFPFSSVAAHIRRTLEPLGAANGSILSELEDNVASMQEQFIDEVYAAFSEYKITLSEKITVGLDRGGILTLLAPHPQHEAILAALAMRPFLSTLFSEIAMQSLALRQLRGLYLLAAAHQQKMPTLPAPLPNYQFSLKGEMNHFFFVPQT